MEWRPLWVPTVVAGHAALFPYRTGKPKPPRRGRSGVAAQRERSLPAGR